jgi:hypothetical protein
MIIKEGQKLWVKQNFIIDEDPAENGAYEHKIGDMCIVTNIYIGESLMKYPISVEFDGREEDYSMDEIEKYFYDKAKWREQQINSILDD